MNESPLPFGIHGVAVFLPQEANAIGSQQLFDGRGVATKLFVEQGHSPAVLGSAENQLLLTLPLSLLIDAGQRRRQGNQQQRGHNHHNQ